MKAVVKAQAEYEPLLLDEDSSLVADGAALRCIELRAAGRPRLRRDVMLEIGERQGMGTTRSAGATVDGRHRHI